MQNGGQQSVNLNSRVTEKDTNTIVNGYRYNCSWIQIQLLMDTKTIVNGYKYNC